MGIIFKVLLCICMTLCLARISLAKQWRGIVPLHSTCNDVKRLLGVTTCDGSYELEGENVYIWFSQCPCYEKMREEWNVPRGTVTAISVRPKRKMQLSNFGVEETKYKKSVDPNGHVYYTNEEAGIYFQTNSQGQVINISYMPAAKDNYLRCPRSSGVESQEKGDPHGTIIFDEYGKLAYGEEKKRLDAFAVQLRLSGKEVKGYILFYGGRRGPEGGAQTLAERAKGYLISKGVDNERIMIMDGGYREELTFELWLVLPGGISPIPSPTVCPDDVKGERRSKTKGRMDKIRKQIKAAPNNSFNRSANSTAFMRETSLVIMARRARLMRALYR